MSKAKVFLTGIFCLALVFSTAIAAKRPMVIQPTDELRIVEKVGMPGSYDLRRDEPDEFWTYRFMVSADGGESWSEIKGAGDTGMYDEDQETTQNGASYDFGALVDHDNNLHFAVVLTAFTEFQGEVDPPRVNGVYDIKTDAEGNATYTLIAAAPDDETMTMTWADCGIDGAGNLYVIWEVAVIPVEGATSGQLWVSKSADDGDNWSNALMLSDELDAVASYPHISPHVGDFMFILYQIPNLETGNYDQFMIKMTSSLDGEPVVIDLESASGTEVSYYIGSVNPVDQDVTEGYVYFVHRSDDVSSVVVGNSDDNGESWNIENIVASQRYPSVALDMVNANPWVFSNPGLPPGPGLHRNWYSYDEGGYNGGSWLDPTPLMGVEYPGEVLYCHNGAFTADGRVVAGCNIWSYPDPVFTPSGFEIMYSDDSGENWSESNRLWHYLDEGNELVASFIPQVAIMSGTDNNVWIAFAAKYGATDVTAPTVGAPTLSSYMLGEPWEVSCHIEDEATEITYADINYITTDEGAAYEYQVQDREEVDEMGYGTYYFTVPQFINERDIVDGDSIWFFVFAQDEFGNAGYGVEALLIVNQGFIVSVREFFGTPATFELGQSYPNPFNNSTMIPFSLELPSHVKLSVYDINGRLVETLHNGKLTSGQHEIAWKGDGVSSGEYFYVLESGDVHKVGKMTLLR